MTSGFLRGRDFTEIGSISAQSEGCAAVAISRGGSAKVYSHTDPNEDAALFADGPGGTLVAVADAHDGFLASEVSLDQLLAHPAEQWTAPEPVPPEAWARHVTAALVDANAAIRREQMERDTPHSTTTLALALVRPREGRLFYAALGDSHLFQVTGDFVVDRARLPKGKSFFLGGSDETESSLRDKCIIGVEPLEDSRAIVLVTDGISERHIGVEDPGAAVARAVQHASEAIPEVRSLEVARSVVETALDAHRRQSAGDNVASAVVWLEEGPAPNR